MIRPRLILMAEGVVRDARSGMISVFNIVETMASPGFPLLVPKLFVLSMLDRDRTDPPDLDVDVVLELDGEEIFRQTKTINFEDTLTNRHIVQFGGVPVPRPGALAVSIKHAGATIQAYTVQVRHIGAPSVIENQDVGSRA